MKYLVVIEQAEQGYSGYAPDLPGCVAVALTRDECEHRMACAVAFHVRSLRASGEAVPSARASASFVEV